MTYFFIFFSVAVTYIFNGICMLIFAFFTTSSKFVTYIELSEQHIMGSISLKQLSLKKYVYIAAFISFVKEKCYII